MARREVRVAESFFEELDRQLPSDRGAHGEPSATDFLLIDLPAIADEFAARFDELPPAAPGVSSIRMFLGSAVLVPAVVVHGVEVTDGIVHLVGVEIDAG